MNPENFAKKWLQEVLRTHSVHVVKQQALSTRWVQSGTIIRLDVSHIICIANHSHLGNTDLKRPHQWCLMVEVVQWFCMVLPAWVMIADSQQSCRLRKHTADPAFKESIATRIGMRWVSARWIGIPNFMGQTAQSFVWRLFQTFSNHSWRFHSCFPIVGFNHFVSPDAAVFQPTRKAQPCHLVAWPRQTSTRCCWTWGNSDRRRPDCC